MAMANMNLIGVFVTKVYHVQVLACGGGGGGGGGGGNQKIIPQNFSNFGDIITCMYNTHALYPSVKIPVPMKGFNVIETKSLLREFHYQILFSIDGALLFEGTVISQKLSHRNFFFIDTYFFS